MHYLMWGPLPRPSQLLQDSTEGAQEAQRVGNPSRRNLGIHGIHGKMPATKCYQCYQCYHLTCGSSGNGELCSSNSAGFSTGRTCWILSDLQRLDRWSLDLQKVSQKVHFLYAMLNSHSQSLGSNSMPSMPSMPRAYAIDFPFATCLLSCEALPS